MFVSEECVQKDHPILQINLIFNLPEYQSPIRRMGAPAEECQHLLDTKFCPKHIFSQSKFKQILPYICGESLHFDY